MWRLFLFCFVALSVLFSDVGGPNPGFHETQANTVPMELQPSLQPPTLLSRYCVKLGVCGCFPCICLYTVYRVRAVTAEGRKGSQSLWN